MTQTITSTDISKKPRRFQFGLRAMLVIVTLTAIGYAIYVRYYRKITVDLSYRLYSIKEEAFDSILSKKMPGFQKDPGKLNFKEFLIDKAELGDLAKDNSPLIGEDFRIVGRGSGVMFMPSIQYGKLDYITDGYMGFHLDDGSKFLRLSLDISYGTNDKSGWNDLKPLGRISYLEKFPRDGLLFFNQLSDRSFLVYVFTAKEVE